MSILVTGGAGFIGANFLRRWRQAFPDREVIVLDALTYAANPRSLEGIAGVELIRGDIRDTALVTNLLRDRRIDRLVHFAAESHVDRSIAGPDAFVDTNVIGTHSLLKAARAVWLDEGSGRPHRFHHISTDEVYGTLASDDPPFVETTAYAPNSPYSATKAASDHLVRAYHHTYGLDTVTTNCSNNYGPLQFPEKLIPLFIINALHGRSLPIYGDGQQIRDWLHVDDHCSGILLALDKGRAGATYNIGGGAEMANLAVIDTLCAALDEAFAAQPELCIRFPDCPAASTIPTATLKTFVKDRPGHDRRYAVDCSLAEHELGYGAAHPFAVRFGETLAWYLDNVQWWRAILSGEYQRWIRQQYA